jgi:membrane protein DedA with SNARE-associated domain
MFFLAVNFLRHPWEWITHTYHHMDALKMVERWMGTDWGYGVLFGLLLSCGLGVPLPEDIPLLLAGYFVANGQMNLFFAAVCAWCGIIGGDCILYSLGRLLGLEITKVPVIGRHISKDRLEKVHVLFEKYGVWVVAIGRLFAGIRGAMVVTAGAIRFTFLHFIIADGLAAIVSGGLFIGLGYMGGKRLGTLENIKMKIEHSQRMVLIVLVIALVIFGLWKWWQNKRHEERKKALIQQGKLREAAAGQD